MTGTGRIETRRRPIRRVPNRAVAACCAGGAFLYTPKNLRSASRFYIEPDNSDGDVGFRCVVDAAGGQE